MKTGLVLWFFFATALCNPIEKVSYRGHKVYSVQVQTPQEVKFLRQLQSKDDELDFWTQPHKGKVHVHVSPLKKKEFLETLDREGLTHEVFIQDIEQSVQLESQMIQESAGSDITQSYKTITEIEEFLDNLATQHPERLSVSTIGTTEGGLPIRSVKISTDLNANTKKAVWIEAGTHAREWISVAVAINTIDIMVKQYNGTGDVANKVTEILDLYDWYFVPVHNPDGYKYSWDKDRLWRKNRRKNMGQCKGVDLNRNWDINWAGVGASPSKCSAIYHGDSALSEQETSALDAAVQATQENQEVVSFISIHAYSQMILLPYGYTLTKPSDYDTLKSIADDAMAALKSVHGTQFVVGTPPDLLYEASGTSADHMKDVRGIKYCFTYELRDQGTFGFELPVTQIQASVQETFASLWSFAVKINEDDTSTGK